MVVVRLRSVRVRALVAAAVFVFGLPTASSAAQRSQVAIGTASYQPSLTTLVGAGDRVRWSNNTSPSRVHDVVSSLPEYFHMPLGGTGTSYAFTFRAAGYFTYFCSIHDTMLGAISVPMTGGVISDSGGTRFHLVVASAAWPAGSRYVSAIWVQGPGDASPHYWRSTRSAALDYVPTLTGHYAFSVRVKDNQTKRHSGDSPTLTFTLEG